MTTSPIRDSSEYVRAVLAAYVWVPATPTRASRLDRRLARLLEQQHVPLQAVLDAILLGTARRTFRNPDKAPLAPVRTLSYFLPVLDEIRQQPPELGYSDYIRGKLEPLALIKLAQNRL